ncbi:MULTISPECIES: hypothetical protein [Pedobacter]|uniref:Vitellogenin II n=1 Tax=Pedobacter heparinus (strain ATCC 13125 / DSM 2366 / CIP 104194 / JCM 7457 / NBRC 12017 / NCIMB 9290 / NRRL B-14731 / HIM 762-3) TaxID=485917 RepID=C6Y1W7_PEDHD|nr:MULTISPECIES: hypothetical protein [Pedobacter]ACU05109.1 hypothetical protein Phep_2911 [Pedobacter heparinus DSM 2366]MBB5439370.1 hypothetical protein [Pedobacter sp. AK017]
MKAINLFTGMALTAIVVASCSAPRLAQQNSNDDVYNSVAKAKEYRQQVPVKESEYNAQDDYYGTSDPYYDMDYSSRINRFSYANPSWRSYYDPYFDGGWYGNYGMSLGLGFGLSPFWGSMWSSPYYGWGNYYSPFYGYNGWGYNNFIGGGYYGGGYWGGGYYTGRTTNVPDYRARPARGGSNGYNGTRGNAEYLSPRSSARGQNNAGNTAVSSGRPSRGSSGTTQRTTESSRPGSSEMSRPSRTETSRPAPTYTPPSRGSEGSSSGGSYGGGSSGGGAGGAGGGGRPSRGGGR